MFIVALAAGPLLGAMGAVWLLGRFRPLATVLYAGALVLVAIAAPIALATRVAFVVGVGAGVLVATTFGTGGWTRAERETA